MSESSVAGAGAERSSTKIFKGWSDFAKIYRLVARDGLWKTLGTVRYRCANRLQYVLDRNFDQENRADTEDADLKDLSIQSDSLKFAVDYVPTSVMSFKRFLRYLPKDLRDVTFVDFGSGKGRAVLIAARYPFREVIGVEFAQELVDIANQNIRNQPPELRTCASLSAVCKDATDFELPDGKLVLYFFDPFGAEIMARVVDRIIASYTANPRPIYIVYHNPDERAVFDRHDVFRVARRKAGQFMTDFVCPYSFVVYEMTGSVSASASR